MRKLKHQKRGTVSASPTLLAKMKAFVKKFDRKHGEKLVAEPRDAAAVEEAPVLKPRKHYRYQFNA